jgi:RNA polymerase sigma factor (sigma-70 family)
MSARNDQIEKLILGFSQFISHKINTFNYQKYGIAQDDLFQEIRIKIWKAYANNGNNIRNFHAYIKKIITSVVVDEIQKSRKEIKTLELNNHNSSNHNDGLQKINVARKEDFKDTLIQSLTGLKDSRQKVIKLFLSDLTLEEIARLNNWSIGKTNNLFYRGLKDLKNKLKVRGVYYEDEHLRS